ncbi:MAG: glycogen synthase GlgA [Burkholderiales bacterium]|nr:glycogen synthase GlgA [Burkholderiales bacterium]
MRVLYVSTEVHPALKTGGLADVNAALPAALAHAGADVRLLLPAFPALKAAAEPTGTAVGVKCPPAAGTVEFLPCRLGGIAGWLVDAPALYARPGNPYVGPDGSDWPDNARRFATLGWAAARFADGGIGHWRADIVHCHDWHAALAPAYLRARGGALPGTVFTIHNLGFQGSFPPDQFAGLGLPAHFFAMHGVEFHGSLNFMKAGIHYADRVTTVSPTYAQEIQTVAHGFGMDGLLRSRAGALTGILNGVDTAAWNPARDAALPAPFAPGLLEGKAVCRERLRAEFGLARAPGGPLIGVVSRLTAQKGLDLLLDALPAVLAIGGQIVMLGSGEPALEARWADAARTHPGTVAVRQGYDEALAHRIFGGADMVAVPSRFEPCGLTQMYGLLYGALPLARRTGGLADTVRDATAAARAAGRANGFLFEAASADDLAAALHRAGALWREPAAWRLVQDVGMRERFGWADAASRYMDVYRDLRPAA